MGFTTIHWSFGPATGHSGQISFKTAKKRFSCTFRLVMGTAPVIEPAPADERTGRPTPQALEGMFARCQGEILGTLYYLLGNWDDARDCLQETFLKCWRTRQDIGKIENLRAWIFRVAINTGRDARATAWRRKKQPLANEAEERASDGPTAETIIIEAERMQRLRDAIVTLRDEEKEIFLLRQN